MLIVDFKPNLSKIKLMFESDEFFHISYLLILLKNYLDDELKFKRRFNPIQIKYLLSHPIQLNGFDPL